MGIIGFFFQPGRVVCIKTGVQRREFYKSPELRPSFIIFFWFWVVSFILLGWLGAKPVEYPYTQVSVLSSCYYFFFLCLYI